MLSGLEQLYHEFAICQDEILTLRDWPVGLVRAVFACNSPTQAAYLAIGASVQFEKLVGIRLPWGDLVTGWPLWSVDRQTAFALGFKWTRDWHFAGYSAIRADHLVSWFSYNHFSRREKAWAWVGYAATALQDSYLEAGASILGGRFKTAYHFAGDITVTEQPQLPF